ncbi:MAG: hypothetical protein KME30_11035 [Iphinoe sp. HA4291-MV1]|jgi:hypothetical protein|nr:hypothetical protein [Iphinoe sp. HA4291-MV1]
MLPSFFTSLGERSLFNMIDFHCLGNWELGVKQWAMGNGQWAMGKNYSSPLLPCSPAPYQPPAAKVTIIITESKIPGTSSTTNMRRS